MIDINKKYRTRAGAEARIYAVDGNEPRPVHGAFKSQTGWVGSCWQQDGIQSVFEGHYDLIEVKPRIQRTLWLNVYADKSGDYSQARSIAEKERGCEGTRDARQADRAALHRRAQADGHRALVRPELAGACPADRTAQRRTSAQERETAP